MNLTSSVTVTDLHTPLLYSNLHFINSYDAKSNATCWLHCFFFSLLAFPENLGEIAETNKYYSAVGYYIHTSRVARLRRATASNACTPMLSATMLLLQLKIMIIGLNSNVGRQRINW